MKTLRIVYGCALRRRGPSQCGDYEQPDAMGYVCVRVSLNLDLPE